jgi:putative redox protein
MSVSIDIVYEGDLHTLATHGPSGATLSTDAPTDNGGRGAAFSPTDLLATSLGACMATIMGLYAKKEGLDIAGAKVRVVKEMVAVPRRRVGRVEVTVAVPAEKAARLTPLQRQGLERAAHDCPVNLSLHPDVARPVKFIWGS